MARKSKRRKSKTNFRKKSSKKLRKAGLNFKIPTIFSRRSNKETKLNLNKGLPPTPRRQHSRPQGLRAFKNAMNKFKEDVDKFPDNQRPFKSPRG